MNVDEYLEQAKDPTRRKELHKLAKGHLSIIGLADPPLPTQELVKSYMEECEKWKRLEEITRDI
jgi:hypothetical protein